MKRNTICMKHNLDLQIFFAIHTVLGIMNHGFTRGGLCTMLFGFAIEHFRGTQSIIIPLSLLNFIAINVSFHSSNILDPTSFERMAAYYNVNIYTFCFLDFVVHVLPLLIICFRFAQHHDKYCNMLATCPFQKYFGVFIILTECSWAIVAVGSIDLSPMYCYMAYSHWVYMWGIGIATHIISNAVLTKYLQFNRKPFFICSRLYFATYTITF